MKKYLIIKSSEYSEPEVIYESRFEQDVDIMMMRYRSNNKPSVVKENGVTVYGKNNRPLVEHFVYEKKIEEIKR